MKITKNRLKQIIKEEIEALGDQRDPSAEDYREKIKGFAKTLKMVENAPDELKKAMKHSVKMSVEDVLDRIADDSVRDGVEKLVEALLGPEYLPRHTRMDNMNESIEDLMNKVGGLMNKAGYQKARDAIESAIDFDEKVENMKDLKDLIKTLGSEKDPMDKDRKEELGDIKNALEAALSNISEAMSDDEEREGVRTELVVMGVDRDIITDDLLNAIMAHKKYREGEPIDADAAGFGSRPGFLTRDDVIELANDLKVAKDKEASHLSEKLKRIIKEEIEALSEQTASPVDLFTNYIEYDGDLGTEFEEFERRMEQKPHVKALVDLAISMNPRMQKLSSPEQQKHFNTVIGLIKKFLKYKAV